MSTEQLQEPQTPQKTDPIFDWLTIVAMVEFTNNQVSENQLRWWLRSRSTNGLDKHVRSIGKKIYISKSGFCKWFEEESV